ncbi:MAG TPA: hypothetical protein VFN02_05335 [Ktedonobacteraceae bacterium]|nr:hypothetical protein [Ktedonobacteraceae bacterium]
MRRIAQIVTLLAFGMSIGALSGRPALAAAAATHHRSPSVRVTVNGRTFMLLPGQEIDIPLKSQAPANVDPHYVPRTLHFKLMSISGTASTSSISPNTATYCGGDGAKAWFSNAFGTTLGSYQLYVTFNADVPNNIVTSYTRTTDQWYANTGLAWYYNTRLDQNTEVNRQAATAVSTIHFTGPFFQTENTEVAVDMHGNCTHDWRAYVFGGDAEIK